jgi:mRNA interferase HigB
VGGEVINFRFVNNSQSSQLRIPICRNNTEERLKSWHKEAEEANWKNPQDIKNNYPAASFLADNRVAFNINGNSYLLIVKINYEFSIVWIRFIGTHSEYDKIYCRNNLIAWN